MDEHISITIEEIAKRFKPTNPKTHKGIQGHALLIGGSYGKIGSVCLSSEAALRSGCGLVTAFIPECGYEVLQTAIPEVMVITNEGQKYIYKIKYEIKPDAIGIGPGIGVELGTQKAVIDFLKHNDKPLVIDADALNILARNKSAFQLLRAKTILTPHQKELQRLVGVWKSEEERLEIAMAFSQKHNVILVLKGAPTMIVDNQKIFVNTTGNAALATAGSGDVLMGMITSLLAQSYNPIDAAILGVYLHGLTADIAIPEIGTHSFIASDIIKYLGKAFISVEKSIK